MADHRPPAIRTFLIADIRGYTRFTSEQGDEAASQLAAKFADVATEGVEAWGGELLELRGDEALAAFDSARQALRAAVELQAALAAETLAEPEFPLRVGIGLDAGEAVALGGGYRGAALNLAARLCALAGAGETVASESVVHLAGAVPGIAYLELAPTELKGLKAPARAVRVADEQVRPSSGPPLPATKSAPPLPAELDPIVPIAGRLAELRWLGWHWRRAGHGAGRAVVISGPPGIGKTRLAAEMARLAHADGASVVYLPAGRGVEHLEDAHVGAAAPALVVVDDLDAAAPAERRAIVELASGLDGARALVLVAHRHQAAKALIREVGRLGPPELRRQLEPLEFEAVRAIAALYAGRAVDTLPLARLVEESAGVPAAVHRLASAWARASAQERLSGSAETTSLGRRGLRAAESELIESVADLELARERIDLYGTDHEAAAAGRVDICPYKGLAAFEAADADYYFGRERLVAELVARLVGTSFLGLVGASGSGKSSALRAGLLPALSGGVLPGSESWRQVVMRPGDRPLAELARALGRARPDQDPPFDDAPGALTAALDALPAGARLVLVVDQFEEVFNAARDEQERQAFVELLTIEREGLTVIVALRADHYGHCAAYPELAGRIGGNQVLVGPPARHELGAVIEHPAQRVGLRVEAGLTEALLDDLGDEPGALPLLSTALLELWQARQGGRLTLAAYRAHGGVRGAVARLAEAAYAQLDEAQREIAHSILLRLAGPGEGEGVVRRRVSLSEFDTERDPAVATVLDRLTGARLLTTGEGYVEVAHEALLRQWPRLQDWLAEDAAGRQLRLHLIAAARDWDARGREAGDLYRGARLAAALDWAPTHEHELNALEREFVEESRLASEREAERQRRINRRLRVLLGAAAVLLLIAVGAGGLALQQRGLAENEASRAEQAAVVAQARELYAAAVAAVDQDPELSILLALEAARLGVEPDAEAVSSIHRAVQEARTIAAFPLAEPAIRPTHVGVAISPDGSTLYAATDSGSIQVFDVATGVRGPLLGTPRDDDAPGYLAIAVSPDGRRVAIVDEETVAHVWDVEDGREFQLDAEGARADIAVFSADGARLATLTFARPIGEAGEETAIVTLFDVEEERKIQEWEVDAGYTISFHPGGEYLLASACPCDPTYALQHLDIASGDVNVIELSADFEEHNPTSAQFSPDGEVLATAGADGTVNLWSATDHDEVHTGDLIRTFRTRTQWVNAMAFSPDGARLATSSRDGTTRVWDVQSGEEEMTLRGQGGLPGLASFSADGSRLATASTNLTARVWDVSPARAELEGVELGPDYSRIFDLKVHGDLVAVLGMQPVESGQFWRYAALLDLSSGHRTDLGQQIGTGLALSSDGRWVVSQAAVPHRERADDLALGPVQAHEVPSGNVAFELGGVCPYSVYEPWNEDSVPNCGIPPDLLFDEQIWAISSGGGVIAATGWFSDGLMTWNATGALTGGPVKLGDNLTWSMAVSPEGSLVAAGTWEKGVVVLEGPGLAEAEILDIPLTNDLRFSPDGSSLAVSASTTGTRLYDVGDWSYRELTPPMYSFGLDFSPDGRTLATYDTDAQVRLWDVATGGVVQAIPLEQVYVEPYGSLWMRRGFVRFLDDAHLLVANREALMVLTTDVDELIGIAGTRVTRGLTDEECQQYLHVDACPAVEQGSAAAP